MLKDNKTVSLGKANRELYKRIAKKKAIKRAPETSKNMENLYILISSSTTQTDSAAAEYELFQRVLKQNKTNFSLNIKRDDCVEALIPQSDNYKLTPASVFRFLSSNSYSRRRKLGRYTIIVI